MSWSGIRTTLLAMLVAFGLAASGWVHAVGTSVEDDDLKPGAVPVAALFRDGDAWAAYVVEGGRAHLRHVRVGQMAETAAEVTGGLAPGAIVVLYPDDQLRDGMRVRSSRIAASR